MPLFRDRADAARALVALLPPEVTREWVIAGLARGGIPVAAGIAHALGAPLEIVIVRKVGVPGDPELALAAVTGPGRDQMVVNETVRRLHGISPAELTKLAAKAATEVDKRRQRWLGDAPPKSLTGRKVLVVDDGMATGATMLAALQVMRQMGAAQIGVAVPVALGASLHRLPADIAPVLCPYPADERGGVGAAYASFPQVSDDEMIRLTQGQAA